MLTGGRYIQFILLLLLISPIAAAEDFVQDVSLVAEKIETFVGDSEDVALVWGSHTSKAERALYAYAKEQYKDVQKAEKVDDTAIPSHEKLLIVGGPWQNNITKHLLADESIEKQVDELTIGIVTEGSINGQDYLIISDYAGYENYQRPLEKSPLAKIMPVKYVPVAAAVAGLTLLWLWHLIVIFSEKIMKAKINSKIMSYVKKKELKKDFTGFHVGGIRIKYREWLSIFIAAAVFALAVSYSFLQEGMGAILFIVLNIFANMIIYALRHLVRLALDRKHELHTEYVVWYWGAFVTVVSGWLGNTFGLAGYTISDKEEHDLRGKIAFVVNILTFAAALTFLLWNFLKPNSIIQMLMVMALSTAAIQMVPMKPFGGKNIYTWNKKIWLLTFIPTLVTYVLVIIIV